MRQRLDENRLYETALVQFADYGYKKTTLEDIAAELNMTGASLYSYASSKQALYHDSVGYALRKWQAHVLDALEGIEDPEEYFITLCRSSIEYLNGDATFRTILKRDPNIFPLFPEADPYEEINRESFFMLKDALDQGVEAGQFEKIDTLKCTEVLFSIYKTMIIETYIKDEAEEVLDTFPEMMQILLNGLKKR